MAQRAQGSRLVDTDLMLTREQEQRMACETLGVQAVEFLRFSDGHLTNTEAARKAIVRLIRKYRPRVIFTHDPTQHIFAPDPDEKPDDTASLTIPITAPPAISCWTPSFPPLATRAPIANCWQKVSALSGA